MPRGDIPAILIKEVAQYLTIPVTDVINCSIKKGQWPNIYKTETITPAPKLYPPPFLDDLRPLSNLYTLNTVCEKLISEMIISDMEIKWDPAQYGNRKKDINSALPD